MPKPNIQQQLALLTELDAFLNCGYQQGEILDFLTSELGRCYRQHLRRGQPLSAVWELEPELVLILRAAELNGRLPDFVALALEYYREKISLQNAVLGKAAYPLLILVFAVLMLLVFVFFLLPLFNGLTVDLGGQPVSAVWQWALLGGLGLTVVNARYLYQLLLDKSGLSDLQTALRRLELLVMTDRAGLPLANFLAEYLRADPQPDLARLYFYLAKGLSVSEALGLAGLFTRAELKLLAVGGGANYKRGLAYLLNSLRQRYQRRITQIIFWFEPALLLLVGGIIAVMSWSFFKPLFQLSGVDF